MAVLHVWNKQRSRKTDDNLEAGSYQPGMVISIHEDGSHRGKNFDQQDYFIAVELPGVPKADLIHLVSPMPGDADGANIPRKRFHKVDIVELRKKYTERNKKLRPSRADFDAQLKQFDYVRDSRVIG